MHDYVNLFPRSAQALVLLVILCLLMFAFDRVKRPNREANKSAGPSAPPPELWRDLAIGETILPGDRIMTRELVWAVWTRSDRPHVVDSHTFPVQRRVLPDKHHAC